MASFALRVLLAGVSTMVVVGVGSAAMLLNTVPEWLSLLFEPLSLLLLPGLLVGVVASGPHELVPQMILDSAVVFYFGVFLTLLEFRAFRRRRQRRRRG